MPLMLSKANLQGATVSSAVYYPWTNAMLMSSSEEPSKGFGDQPDKSPTGGGNNMYAGTPSAGSQTMPNRQGSAAAPSASAGSAAAPSAGDRVVGMLAAGASALVSQYAPAGTANLVNPLINSASALLQEAL